eukprot:gene3016-3297_t
MGAGYVSIPYACFQGGWAALAVLWLLGACFCYTGAGTPEAEQPQAGYESVAAAAFGKLGLAAVSSVMYAELLGICCVYVVLE